MPGSALTDLLASYVPKLIRNRVIQNPKPIDTPFVNSFYAVVLLADISGFTALTERLAEKGPIGVEKLARILNEYFGQLIDLVYDFGGDVVKFAGDAVIAAWPFEAPADPVESGFLETQRQWTLRAADCAFEIRERLLNYQTDEENLDLKISLAVGRVWESHIGGIFNRWEFVMVGQPMVDVGVANDHAKPGEIIAAPSAWSFIRDDCEGAAIEFNQGREQRTGARLERLNGKSSLPMEHEILVFPDGADAALRPYIPGSIISRIAAGQADWLAELRKVTILFVNLPGIDHTTSLKSAQETMRIIQRVVYRFEGSINKISQDDKGVMVDTAFGLPPLAHADDPVRGVQAAIALRDELSAMGVNGAIGLTTGRVFLGLVGTDRRREYTFLGNSANLAARLMSLAYRQNELRGVAVYCDRSTYEAARNRAEFETLSPQKLKGRSEPVDVFRPLREKKDVLRAQTDLIGRLNEKSLLVNAIQEVQRGVPFQAIILHGEAGIGKSRLLTELMEQAKTLQMHVLLGAGDPIEKNNPYFAWRSIFARLLGIEEIASKMRLSDEDRRAIHDAALQKLTAMDSDLARYAPLLNVVLPVSIPENETTSAMTGEVRGGNIRDLLVRLLQNEASHASMLLCIEDLHWLDSASWTLLVDATQKVRPLLLGLSTRPLSPPVPPQFHELADRAETKFVKLDMMSLDDVEQLVCQRFNVTSIPAEAARLIREKSEGHPFFAEELAYALRDSGVLILDGNECRLAPGLENLNSVTLPDNLEAAITSRIDGLNPSQQLTLKVASVIGRIFAYRMLHAIHPIESDKPSLSEYLSTLTRMNLTLIEAEAPDMAYIFKHAVTQEVAYNLMLYSQRRQLHQAVAEWIENSYEQELASYYALLAYHWIQAADDPEPAMRATVIRKAVTYLEKAGDQSLNNFANAEASRYFTDLLRFKEDVRPSKLQLGQWYRKLAMAHLGMGSLTAAKANFLKALETLGQRVPATGLGMIGGLLMQLTRQTSHRLFPRIHRGRVVDPEQVAMRIETVQILQEYATVLFLIGDANPLPMFHSVVTGLNTAETIPDSAELAYMYAQMGAICGFIPLRGQAAYYTEQWRVLNEKYYNANFFVGSAIALATVESGIGSWEPLKVRLERLIEICNDVGDNRQAGEALSFMAANAVIEGNLPAVNAYNARLLENGMRRNHPVQLVWSSQWAGSMAVRCGEYDRALEATDRALNVMKKTPVGEIAEITIPAIRMEALWWKGERETSLAGAKKLLDRTAKMQVVDYSIVIGFFHSMAVLIYALEQAYEEDHSQAEKDELMKYARLSFKVMKSYARVFTVGEPIFHRYLGWVEWYSGNKEKAYKAWRAAGEKAHPIPMHYEEGIAWFTLADHLPVGHPERGNNFRQAMDAFERGGFKNWAEKVRATSEPR